MKKKDEGKDTRAFTVLGVYLSLMSSVCLFFKMNPLLGHTDSQKAKLGR